MVTLDEIYSKLRQMEEKNKEQMFEIERRLAKLESGRSSGKDSAGIDERLADLEDLLRMNELELLKLNERISSGADVTSLPADVRERLDNLEQKLSFAPADAMDTSGVGASEISAKMDAVEERVNSVESTVTDKLDTMNSKLNDYANRMKDAHPISIDNLGKRVEKLKEIESRLDTELGRREGILKRMEHMGPEADRIQAAMASARATEEKIRNDIELLNATKDEMYRKVDNSMRRLQTLEEEIEQRMANAESKINSGLDKITHTQETLDMQMTRLDRKFALIDKGGLSDEVLKNMNRKVTEYQYKINQLAEQLKGLDISKLEIKLLDLSERIEHAERKSDERSIRFLTEQLEQFAKMIDDKIPQLPSHNQFDNIMRRIEQIDTKIMHIQRPNIMPLEQRVNELANRIDAVISVLQRTNERVAKRIGRPFPVIVD